MFAFGAVEANAWSRLRYVWHVPFSVRSVLIIGLTGVTADASDDELGLRATSVRQNTLAVQRRGRDTWCLTPESPRLKELPCDTRFLYLP